MTANRSQRRAADRVLDAFTETYREDISEIRSGIKDIVKAQQDQQKSISILVTAAEGDLKMGVEGYGSRIKKLEVFKANLYKMVGILAGIGIVLGTVIGVLIRIL